VVAREFQPLADQQRIRLTRNLANIMIVGDEDALTVALSNLLSNALRHARTEIQINAGYDTDSALLWGLSNVDCKSD